MIEWSNSRGFNLYDGDRNNTQVLQHNYSPNGTGWNHVAISRESNTCRLFINGVLEKTVTYSNTISCSNSLMLGKLLNGNYPYNGYLSDILISKGIARYTASFDAVVSYKPDTIAGTGIDSYHKLVLSGSAADASDSAHTLTFSGPTLTTPASGSHEGSFYRS